MEEFQKARDEWNKERVKRLDFINKRLREQQDARQAIIDLKDGMREYYQVFGQKIKPLPKKPVLTDFYHPSRRSKEMRNGFHRFGNRSCILLSIQILLNKWKS